MARRTGRAPAPAASGVKSSRTTTRPQRTGPKSIHDVYDYAVNQEERGKGKADRSIRRAKLGADVGDEGGRSRGKQRQRDDDDDGDDGDSDIDSGSDDSRSHRHAGPSFLDASDEEAEGVNSEDDSDIDSDEAFGESEDEMGGGANAGGKRDDDSEDESGAEDFEDDEGSDVVDLSRLLDDDGGAGGDHSILDSEDGEEDEESDSASDEDEDEDVEDRLTRLAASYAQSASKRSAGDDEDDDTTTSQATKRQRRLLSARTEAVPESESAATSSSSRGQNIGIEDLLGSLSKGTAGDLSALRASTKALRQSDNAESRQPVASRRGGGALAAPLPDVVKDRIQRAAGYDLSKEEADKWQSTIKRLREAEHLSFPLQGGPSRPKATTARLAASYKPSNALEQDIEGILQAQGLSEAQIAKHEELAMRKIDPEEAQRRRDELRQMRELMFRAEQKAKRTNKIKSKAFRKIARKDKERQREKMIAAGILPDDDDDDDLDGEVDSADRAKAERLRAKERATLKHKNTGKWAKAALGRTQENEETRDAINEQLQRSEQLRKRIQGRGSDDDSSDDDDDDSESGDAVQSAFDEIRTLEAREEAEARADDATAADNTGKKGVWNMKFMKDARSRDDAVARQSRRELEDELRKIGGSDESGDDSSDDEAADRQPTVGRRVFESKGSGSMGASGKVADARPTLPTDSDDEEDESRAVPAPAPAPSRNGKQPRRSLISSGADPAADDDGSNPWLSASKSNTRPAGPVTQSSSAASKSALRLDKHKSKSSKARAEADDDAQVEIDPSALISGGKVKSSAVQIQPPPQDDGSDDASSSDEEPAQVQPKSHRAQSQRDLIAEAFAGDDVTSDFAASKAAAVALDAPQEINDDLPGWGSWGGKGAKRSKSQKHKRTTTLPGLDPSKRKDAHMSNVIINERRDKKLDKYHAKELPYPYTSAKQYQAAIAQPIGPEWNTLTQNQRLVMPRVLQSKPGSVIKPVKRVG